MARRAVVANQASLLRRAPRVQLHLHLVAVTPFRDDGRLGAALEHLAEHPLKAACEAWSQYRYIDRKLTIPEDQRQLHDSLVGEIWDAT